MSNLALQRLNRAVETCIALHSLGGFRITIPDVSSCLEKATIFAANSEYKDKISTLQVVNTQIAKMYKKGSVRTFFIGDMVFCGAKVTLEDVKYWNFLGETVYCQWRFTCDTFSSVLDFSETAMRLVGPEKYTEHATRMLMDTFKQLEVYINGQQNLHLKSSA